METPHKSSHLSPAELKKRDHTLSGAVGLLALAALLAGLFGDKF